MKSWKALQLSQAEIILTLPLQKKKKKRKYSLLEPELEINLYFNCSLDLINSEADIRKEEEDGHSEKKDNYSWDYMCLCMQKTAQLSISNNLIVM